MKQLIFTK